MNKKILKCRLKLSTSRVNELSCYIDFLKHNIDSMSIFKTLIETICKEYDLKYVPAYGYDFESEFMFKGHCPRVDFEEEEYHIVGCSLGDISNDDNSVDYVFVGNLTNKQLNSLKKTLDPACFKAVADISGFFYFYYFGIKPKGELND